MRIEGPDRAEISGPSGADNKAPRRPKPADAQSAVPAESLAGDPSCEGHVRKAAACEELDLQAIAEAKKLLESGRLDTPEAAARAAEKIADGGI